MEELAGHFERLGVESTLYGPKVLGAVLFLLGGIALAYLIERVARGFASRLPIQEIAGVKAADALFAELVGGLSAGTVALRLIRYTVIGVAVVQAARFLELDALVSVMSRAAEILPTALVVLAILALGVVLSNRLAVVASRAAERSGIIAPGLAGMLLRIGTLAAAVTLTLEAAGFAIDLPVVVLGISLAAVLALLVVSFVVGARGLIESLLAARYVEEHYVEGQVLEFRGETVFVSAIGEIATTIRNDSDQERIIPNAIFMREAT